MGRPKNPGTPLPPLLLTIPEVAKALGLCRATVYNLIQTDGLPTVKLGRAVRVRVTSLQAWLDQRERQGA